MLHITEERGLTFREVYELLGLRCKTSHTARNMAKRGQIHAIQLNGRVIRYSLTSVMKLLEETGGKEANVHAYLTTRSSIHTPCRS